jgi:hypothetical protein
MHTAARYLLTVAVLTACDGASAPTPVEIETPGPSFADITINCDAWTPETRGYFRNGDFLSFGFDRYVPGTTHREGIGLVIPHFTGEGSYPLRHAADSTASAGYGVIDTSAHTAVGMGTVDAKPGLLRITGFHPTDSTIAGTFHFVAAFDVSPSDTTSVDGSFRIRPSEQLP